MENNSSLSRRRFLTYTVLGTASLLYRCNLPYEFSWRYLTLEEGELLDAVVEQIIPTDEWPGARDAGVTNFIDLKLTKEYKRFQDDYREGLKALQNHSLATYHKKFEQLDWDNQTHILEQMEQGNLGGENWANGFDRHFFNLVRNHTLQGFYGSPRHGGNKRYISFKMLQLDYPHIIGRNHYTQ